LTPLPRGPAGDDAAFLMSVVKDVVFIGGSDDDLRSSPDAARQ
jgi:hypothetical protein